VKGSSWLNVLGNNTGSSFAIDSEYALSIPKETSLMVIGRLWRNARHGTSTCEKIWRRDVVDYLLQPLPEVGGFFGGELTPANWIVRYFFPLPLLNMIFIFLIKKCDCRSAW